MADQPIHLTPSGPPTTVIGAPDADAAEALQSALEAPAADRKALVGDVVARWPRFLDGWAALGTLADSDIEAYAYYRVGYHRGLDTLRGAGWRGSGYVRWAEPTNLGFLRALLGLQRAAAAIHEADEDERCRQFLLQLDPSGVPDDE
ncbi:MAG: DUF3151 family protein [Actinomycetota bacterium]|jgi:hypothetical protein|nr:DUF3151 family protein [Actinomycetota bacterium]